MSVERRRGSARRALTRACGLGLVALAVVACRSASDARRDRTEGRVASGGGGVVEARSAASALRVDGTSVLSLGDDRGDDAAASLLVEVREAVAAGKGALATAAVRRRPDAALAALSLGTVPAPAELLFVAAVHDAQAGVEAASDGWLAALRPGGRATRADISPARAEAVAALRSGDAKGAASRAGRLRSLVAGGPTPLFVDAWRLEGVALVLAGAPAEAAVAFAAGADAARRTRPYEAAHLSLLATDARGRAGDPIGARRDWEGSLALAATVLAVDPDLLDPAFWERALSTRPADAAWPTVVGAALGAASRRAFGGAARGVALTPGDPSLVWGWIARGKLRRGDPRGALLASSRAESSASAASWRDRLRVEQARALARMGESSRAQGILATVADKPDSAASPSAMALFGTLELERGRTGRARALLERALAAWPEPGEDAPEAEANLAMIQLADGRAAEGLPRLRGAQARFQAEGRTTELLLALENELAWAEHAKDLDRVAEVRGRIAAVHAAS